MTVLTFRTCFLALCLLPCAVGAQTFQFAFEIGELGTGDGQFSRPHNVAIDSQGNIYIPDFDNNRVQKLDDQGRFLLKWGSGGSGNGQFNGPVGIAIDSADFIYVVELRNHRVQKFDSSGNFILSWGTQGTGTGQFNNPSGVAVGPDDTIYVADRSNHRIQAFTLNGGHVRTIGSQGTANGQFQFPTDLAVSAGSNRLHVADQGNDRIQILSTTGNPITVFGTSGNAPGQLNGPSDVAVAPDGDVIVVDKDNARVQVFSFEGELFSLFGSPGTGPSQFNQLRGAVITADDKLFVADRDNHRIQVFQRRTDFEIENSTFNDGEMFGQSMAISGQLVAFGVPGRNEVDIYRREGNSLIYEESIGVPVGFTAAEMGASVALQDGVLVVGAPGTPAAKGNNIQALIFQRLQGGFQFKLGLASNQQQAGDRFGTAVAMDGNMVAVGAPMDNGGQGAVYVFRINPDATSDELVKLPPPGPGAKGGFSQLFGQAIAFKQGKLAIGGPGNGTDNPGLVALHDNIANNVNAPPQVFTGATANGDAFGDSITLDGDLMLAGAPGQDQQMGAAYVFPLTGSVVSGVPITPANRQTGARFGDVVALQSRRAIIGAPGAFLFTKGLSGGAAFNFEVDATGGTTTATDLPPESGTCGKQLKGCGVPGVEGYGETAAIQGAISITGAPQAYNAEGTVFVTLDTITLFGNSFEGTTVFE